MLVCKYNSSDKHLPTYSVLSHNPTCMTHGFLECLLKHTNQAYAYLLYTEFIFHSDIIVLFFAFSTGAELIWTCGTEHYLLQIFCVGLDLKSVSLLIASWNVCYLCHCDNLMRVNRFKMNVCTRNETMITASMYYNQPLPFKDRRKQGPNGIILQPNGTEWKPCM
jgi:hypothetical protein